MRYVFLPQVLPRLHNLFGTGFGHLALFIALVYRAVNILPANHPILMPENRHLLGVRNVLAAASAELKFTRSEIDKIIIYFAVLIGLVIMVVQVFALLGVVMLNPAFATTMPTTYAEFFATPQYTTDVAYRILNMVFGVPELFGPTTARGQFHVALHSLFQLYSIGLLVIAVLITAYMVFAVLVETAQTGVPFGRRYNHVWAPIRFVIALGLLIPVGYGLNSGQWIALYAAKFGSDFATRGWIIFNETMVQTYLHQVEQRVGRPQAPDLTSLAAFMMTVHACRHSYETLYAGEDPVIINAYLTSNSAIGGGNPPTLETGFDAARARFNNGDILIRFGEYSTDKHPKWLGNVKSYCGDIVIVTNDTTEPGSLAIQRSYYQLLQNMWRGDYQLRQWGIGIARTRSDSPLIRNSGAFPAALPPSDYKSGIATQLAAWTETAITAAVTAQAESPTWDQNQALIAAQGWGGAGIWYNKIAQINGSLVTAVRSTPQLRMMPDSMEHLKAKQMQQNTEVAEPYKLFLADGQTVKFNSDNEERIAHAIVPVHEYWVKEDTRQDTLGSQVRSTNNIIIDVINLIFGTKGLFDMCASAEVHPLSQLSTLGRGLIEASIRNLALAVGASALGVIPISFVGIASGAAAKMLLSVASITITMGFILFYVIPFMPFLYFFFAVGGWVKGLFEALVGIPLWALAHLRIDGEGLPGEAAISGYYLIFEIFLRPILIIFGLLASVIIFAAMVKVLNDIFHLVVVNLSGHDGESRTLCTQMGAAGGGAGGGGGGGEDAVQFFRGPIDELFFTILYAIIVYMIGMSCFKLIDLVPNNLLRYMNVSVSTFNDQQSDPAEGLVQRLSFGGSRVSSQVMDIGQQGLGALRHGANAAMQFTQAGNSPGR